MLKAGWGKANITPRSRGMLMMGWAREGNSAEFSQTPLYCRAIWLMSNEVSYLMVYLDICFITMNLHDELVNRIAEQYGLKSEQIHLTVSHTHSAPGGYGDKLYYEVPTPGYIPEVFETYVQQSLVAVRVAKDKLSNAKTYLSESIFPLDVDVAFNRSLRAYLKNLEATGSETVSSAVNRKMKQLHILKEGSQAVINWFGCHATSMPGTSQAMHFDNKGYACQMMESYLGEDSLAIFAQGCAGDITPNYIYDPQIKHTRGPYENFSDNAQYNGGLQFNQAKQALDQSSRQEVQLDFTFIKKTFNFSKLKSKNSDLELGPASVGVAFVKGTLEGPGIHAVLAKTLELFVKIISKSRYIKACLTDSSSLKELKRHHKIQGNKIRLISPTLKTMLGFSIDASKLRFFSFDPLMKKMQHLLKQSRYRDVSSWYQEDLPLQIIGMGDFYLVTIPFELTTMSGRRVEKSLESVLNKKIILNPYSNAYAGYITTPEEYDEQAYEGGHTVFGRESLPLLIEKLIEMSASLS